MCSDPFILGIQSSRKEAYILPGLCWTMDAFSFYCQVIFREVRGPGMGGVVTEGFGGRGLGGGTGTETSH